MGRREARAHIESTWVVNEPRVRGVPIRKKDMEDAVLLESQQSPREQRAAAILAMLAVADHNAIRLPWEDWCELRLELERLSTRPLKYRVGDHILYEDR